MQHVPFVILGAGLAGLSTATALGADYVLLEREDEVGGLARTRASGPEGAYRFDATGHWLHLRHPHIRALVEDALDGELLTVTRRSSIYSHGAFTAYPFQANFHGLPPQVVRECLLGFIEARLAEARGEAREPRHFGDYIQRHFGAGIARHFMVPYNTRLWGVSPEEITAEWCGRFIPRPSLEQVVDGALGSDMSGLGYNASFVYPDRDGIGALPKALARRLPDIRLGAEVQAVDPERRVVRYTGGELRYDHLVSSLPLPSLVSRLDPCPPELQAAASKLRATRLRYLDVAIRGRGVLGGNHWVYVPEERWPFYRLGCYSNAVDYMAPPGVSTLYVELSNLIGPEWTEARLLESLVSFFVEIGEAEGPEDILYARLREIPVAYVIFDHDYFESTRTIHEALTSMDIRSIGRYGRWIYNSMEDSLQDGLDTARSLKGEDA
jgi:protoporphyrinogen oxidase